MAIDFSEVVFLHQFVLSPKGDTKIILKKPNITNGGYRQG